MSLRHEESGTRERIARLFGPEQAEMFAAEEMSAPCPVCGAPAPQAEKIRMHTILQAVIAETGVSEDEFRSRRQTRRTADARHLFVFLARFLTPCSLPEIGRYLGRGHTTVLNSLKRMDARLELDGEWRRLAARAEARARAGIGLRQ
jgi:hypothetical protein